MARKKKGLTRVEAKAFTGATLTATEQSILNAAKAEQGPIRRSFAVPANKHKDAKRQRAERRNRRQCDAY